jgi:predicted methyltransferase
MDLAALSQVVTTNSKIFVGPRDLEKLIGAVKKTQNLWEIVDISDFPVPAVFEALRVLKEQGLIGFDSSSVVLTEEGTRASAGIPEAVDLSCPACEGRGLNLAAFRELRERFFEIQRERPEAVHRYDQGYVTPTTTFSRFLIAYERGDVRGRDILILGDDDLMSIMLGLSGAPKSITVVEIDERLVEFIKRTAQREGFSVNVERVDLRRPLSDRHAHAYDTFFTDPPETLIAIDAFVGRGIHSLKAPGCAGYFGFTRREASLTKWHSVQEMLLKYRVVFTDIIHNFNEYVNWDYEEETRAWELAPVKVKPTTNWYRSALFRIETLEGFTGNKKDYGDAEIHEDVESSTT